LFHLFWDQIKGSSRVSQDITRSHEIEQWVSPRCTTFGARTEDTRYSVIATAVVVNPPTNRGWLGNWLCRAGRVVVVCHSAANGIVYRKIRCDVLGEIFWHPKSDPHPQPFPSRSVAIGLSASVYVCRRLQPAGDVRDLGTDQENDARRREWSWADGMDRRRDGSVSGVGGRSAAARSRFAWPRPSLWVVDRYRLAGWLAARGTRRGWGVYVVGGSGSDAAGRTRPGLRCGARARQSMPFLTADRGDGRLPARAVVATGTRNPSTRRVCDEFFTCGYVIGQNPIPIGYDGYGCGCILLKPAYPRVRHTRKNN
jgi:hypothetical protein